MNLLKQMFSQDAHWQINKDFARAYGLDCAMLLSDLVDKWIYFGTEWFFNTSDNIQHDTTLTRFQQDKAIKTLIENGFIETKLMGLPAKKHFRINENNIANFFKTSLSENYNTVCKKITNLNVKNLQTFNNNKEIIINNNNKEEEPLPLFEPEPLPPPRKPNPNEQSQFQALFYNLHNEHSQAPFSWSNANLVAIRGIIHILTETIKLNGLQDEYTKEQFLTEIFARFKDWDAFHKKDFQPYRFEQNLSSIINTIFKKTKATSSNIIIDF